MEHPDLTWRIHQSIVADRERRAIQPNDTGVAYVTRKVLGRALIALGTRLTPAPADRRPQPLELPRPAAPSLKS